MDPEPSTPAGGWRGSIEARNSAVPLRPPQCRGWKGLWDKLKIIEFPMKILINSSREATIIEIP